MDSKLKCTHLSNIISGCLMDNLLKSYLLNNKNLCLLHKLPNNKNDVYFVYSWAAFGPLLFTLIGYLGKPSLPQG